MLKKLIAFLEGEYKLGGRIKEQYLIGGIGLVHFFYLIMFVILEYWVIVAVNIVSLTVYLVCMTPKLRTNYFFLCIAMTTEVLVHMTFAVICVGWSYGYELYIIMLVPALYYIKYCSAILGQRTIHAWIGSLFCMLAFILLKVYTYGAEPLYAVTPQSGIVMSLFNGLMGFLLLFFLMSTFIGAIRLSERLLKEKNEKLNNMANKDPLTELYNRRGLAQVAETVMERAKHQGAKFCVIMSDIDDFKVVNDTYGHACGDYVLQRVAETMREYTRHNDCICRWGGEEILILLNDCEYNMGVRVAEKLRKKIEDIVMEYNEEKIRFTMTFGIKEYIKGMTFEEVVEGADEKMYLGKNSGKNKVV